ncbi:surface-adhesin E family protein [Flavobacterium sp.]|uniref:surface-adhesin E family protein n=1 Tax=Flavobacterium sp. TaxID=239 RepID=UPI003D6C53C8
MKKILLLLSLFTFSFSYSQDWKLLFDQENGEYYYKPNTYDTAWIKIVSEKTKYYPNKASQKEKIVDGYQMVLWKFDCNSKQLGIIQSTVYSKDGKMLQTFKQNEVLVEMNYVNPDSVGEGLLNQFCESE